MTTENALPAGGSIDPAAIELIGTYIIDLTVTIGSDIAIPDGLQPMVS